MNIFEQRKKEKEAEDAAKKAAEQPRPKALPLDEGIAIAPPPVPADPAKQPQPPPDKPTPTDIFRQRRDEARQDLPSPQAPPIPSLPHVEPPKPAQPLSIPAPEVKPPTEPLKEIQKVEPEPQPLPEPKAIVRQVEKPDPILDVVRDLNAATTANMMEQIGKLEEKVDRVFDDFAEDLGGGESEPAPSWSFKVTLSGSNILVADGYRCVIDLPWEAVSTSPIPYTPSSGTVYMVRYYPTTTDGIPNDDGYWSDVIYGTPPANSTLLHVFRIASISSSGVVAHEHLGNISVVDRVDC